MIAQPFVFAAPAVLEDALRLRSENGADAVVIGGGTWAVPNLAAARDTKLVLDLRRLSLRSIDADGERLSIGACVTYDDVIASAQMRRRAPLLVSMAEQITGGPQIRGRATLAGSACYANPASDVPACLVALGASLTALSKGGAREIAARQFFVAPFRTRLRPDEIVVSINVPFVAEGTRDAYHKLKVSEGSWPIATAACLVGPASGEGASALSIGIGGVSPVPILFETSIRAGWSGDTLRQIASEAASSIVDEWSDELAGPGYRRAVAPAVIGKALHLALGGAA